MVSTCQAAVGPVTRGVLMHQSMWKKAQDGEDVQPWLKEISQPLGILTWPYWSWGILTLNFITEVGMDRGPCWMWGILNFQPCPVVRILTQYLFYKCQNPHGLPIFPHHITLTGSLHISKCGRAFKLWFTWKHMLDFTDREQFHSTSYSTRSRTEH